MYTIDSPAACTISTLAFLFNVILGFCSTLTVAVLVPLGGGSNPFGGVPSAVAVLSITSLFISSCVTTLIAVPTVDFPGNKVVVFSTIPSLNIGSDTSTLVKVVFPVFLTTKVYKMLSPALVTTCLFTVFSKEMLVFLSELIVTLPLCVGGSPKGGSPLTVALFTNCPESNSSCVTI